jgi:hypothetical protein
VGKPHAVLVASCVATLAFALAFVVPSFVAVPMLWYHPADRDWTFEVKASGIAMDFYGRCTWAVLASGLLGAGGYFVVRGRRISSRLLAVLTVWAIAVAILVMAFVVWRLVHREPVPPPIPSWYQPR